MSKGTRVSWPRSGMTRVPPSNRLAERPSVKGRARVLSTSPRVALVCVLLSAIYCGTPRVARADIAPPEQPPGSSLAPEAEFTNVVMVSEEVRLTVQSTPWNGAFSAEEDKRGLTRDWARVEAHFVMRSSGTQGEAMAVRFPLSAPLYYESPANEIHGLRVRVDGRPVATRRIEAPFDGGGNTEESPIGWAVFDVDFPAGEEVRIDVEYPLRATGYANQESRFVYVLGTGAGWRGEIGQADIRLRLPYPASIENIVDYDAGWMTPGYQLEGSEIRWSYADLEPEAGQVVTATLVAVDLWQGVVKAEADVIPRAEDGAAWGALARAAKIALCSEKGYWPRQDAGGRHLAERSLAAYEKATALAPDDARWHAGYAELLAKLLTGRDADDPMLGRAVVQLNAALELEPTNAQALQVVEDLRGRASIALEYSAAGARVVMTTSTPTVGVPAAGASQTIAPSRAATREAATFGPTAATTTPESAQASGRGGGCLGSAAAIALAAPLLVVISRSRRSAAGGRAPSAH
ncbi:MAG TPA: hypothetical protein VJJ70_03795 [Anaerolineales bacterium]|nr:hypothetical protein [Anaerolineales bacterium]